MLREVSRQNDVGDERPVFELCVAVRCMDIGALDVARLPQGVGDHTAEGAGILVRDADLGGARGAPHEIAEEAEDDDRRDKEQSQGPPVAPKSLQQPARDGSYAMAAHDSLLPASARNASSRF